VSPAGRKITDVPELSRDKVRHFGIDMWAKRRWSALCVRACANAEALDVPY
jgi:hypothetical protein